MNRQEILNEYNVSKEGVILSPGKFEGEMLYVPHYWGIFLEGCADRDDGKVLGFNISFEDRVQFPELGKRRRTVKLYQRDDGFVCEV